MNNDVKVHFLGTNGWFSTKTGDMYKNVQGKKVIDVPYEWRIKNEGRIGKKFRSVLRGKKKKKK